MLKRLLLLSLLLVMSVISAQAAGLTVADATITTAIENQMPVDKIDVYPADYGKLFCFTRILGADEESRVTHVWYYQDDEMARVSLTVGSADWRTYSSKRFLPQWAGQWKVVVLDPQDQVIATIPFVLE